MSDSRLHSLHLEGLPRRDEFRAAREKVREGCGQMTLAGDFGLLAADDPGDGVTVTAPSAANQTYWLQDGEQLHSLSVGVNSVGRLPDNDVVLRDQHVSRRHCAVVIHRDGRCEVYDIASKNGTVLNGHKITSATRIKPGDQIVLCTRKLVFLTGHAGPAPSAPAPSAPAPAAG
jgi:pSer/pThr/pTyr-binding forkhead associated (FHA) protein